MVIRILATFLIWLCTYAALVPLSFVAVPVMLAQGWEGYSTLFGNRKYGRYGNKAYLAENRWQEWWFLCIRNPISNFGKEVLSVPSTASWPWHYDIALFWRLRIKAGWKEVKDPANNPERTFVFRPYVADKKGRG